MKNTFKAVIIFFSLSCSINYCKCQTSHTTGDNMIVKDIPKDAKGKPRVYYLKKFQMEEMIGLRSIENGFDSIQIRIWYGVALMNKLQLIVLSNNNGAWSSELYTIKLNYDKNYKSLISITKSVKSENPQSGWKDFLKRLFKMDIVKLPDSNSIDGYGDCNDGDGVTIEISTQKLYRIYNYQCFRSQIHIEPAKKIESIMELLEKEFVFKRLSLK